MSSPSHPTSNIEDVFSSNFSDYISASPDYVPTSPGKTYSSSSNNLIGLVPIASPTLSLFHDDPYMKVMHAYYAKESPIPPPIIMPPSSMLSPITSHDSGCQSRKQDADSVSASLEAKAATWQIQIIPPDPRENTLFSRSNCTEDYKVKFATGTLAEEALSRWNSFDQPIGIEEACKIT
ncbi:hypothetical protein Tco_0929226 [Tanacetum coccineum]